MKNNMEENLFKTSKIVIPEGMDEKFGIEAIELSIKWNELLEELDRKEKSRMSKERVTFCISEETLDRVKNAVYWTPGMTLSAFSEEALIRQVELMEMANGSKFKIRTKCEFRGK